MGADVVVVGAGVAGLVSAWRLAQAGADVIVVDAKPGRGASWAAAGMLAPVTELHVGEEALLAFALAARDRWPSFAEELSAHGDVGYVRCGTVLVARDADDAAVLREQLSLQGAAGAEVAWLRSRELRRLEPGLAPGVRGGVRVDGDHQVDNRALVTVLLDVAGAAGSQLERAEVHEVLVDGAVRGVMLADGRRIAARHVVLAAGAWSGRIGGLPPGVVPAVRPVKGQLLHLRAERPPAVRNVRGVEVYVVSRPDGRVVVGATTEEQGFDTTPTAGAAFELLRAALELLPDLREARLVEVTAGLRPGTPDNAPLLGPAAGVEGLVLATGAYRNGVLLAPLIGEVVAAHVTGAGVPAVAAAFRVDRFAGVTS